MSSTAVIVEGPDEAISAISQRVVSTLDLVESAPDYEDANWCSSRGQIPILTPLLLVAARISRGAIPLPPRWLWVSRATGAAVMLAAGGGGTAPGNPAHVHRRASVVKAVRRLDRPSWHDRGVHHFGWQLMVHG